MFTLAVGLIGLLFGSVISAQEVPEQKANISDKELKAFAKAYVEVDKIRLAYEPSLRNAQSPEQVQNIQQEATVKMEKALEEQGLTSETYVRIFNVVNDDVELRGKTLKLIEEERKNL
jgi:hypothetical protein